MIRAGLARARGAAVWLWRRRWFKVYLALLALSHLVIALFNPDVWVGYARQPPTERVVVSVPVMRDDGPRPGTEFELALLRWAPEGEPAAGAPILLLHGSPSQGAADFRRFGPALAERGFEVYALDRPGFGASDKWAPSYSLLANARYALAAMDRLGVERAHAVGWSQSGGVILRMADLEPGRLASLTMLGAIGIQEGEGSGDYFFEHAKYALGYAGLVVLPELLPHFNLIGDRALRHAFIRDFWDSDQRPLRAIMESLETPTLILHGRGDPLVPAWVAEAHHGIIGPSRLVVLDASHFFPVGAPMSSDEDMFDAADIVAGFALRHDEPGVAVRRGAADFAPEPPAADEAAGPLDFARTTPWWAIVLLIALATLVSEDLTVIAVGLLIVSGRLDVGVGALGCVVGIVIGDYGLWAIGRFAGRRVLRWPFFRRVLPENSLDRWGRVFDRHIIKTVFLSRMLPGTRLPMYLAAGILAKRAHHFLFWVTVAVIVWTPLLLLLTALIGPKIYGFFEGIFHGPWAVLAAFAVLALLVRLAAYEATALGRQRLRADLRRLVSPEFWPAWLFYAPVAPWLLALAVRFRGPLVFSCVNPGIPNGGGIVGESKHDIARAMPPSAPMLHARLVDEGPAPLERAREAVRLVEEDERLGGYPVVVKPDFAQRGHGVRLARTPDDLRAYFEDMTRPALLQRYHPGPGEAGILWSRVPTPGKPVDEWPGEIFSITRKEFPEITGDGQRTLERLIWDHPRYRMQAGAFLRRFADRTDLVLPEGETLRLAVAGNHCQGAKFLDGADLITPELTARIDAIARAYREPETGRAIDFGRFDVRYESDDALRRAEGLAIVELNGTMSESTNIYDPGRSALWGYAVLYRQWARVFRIGAARRAEGARPMSLGRLRRVVREHYHGRPGSPVSD